MTRMNPLRRLAASVAIVGVTGFGAVALAGPALADTTAPVATPVAAQTTSVAPAATPGVSMSDLLAGVFSTAKSVGAVDLTKIDTLTPMTINDLTAVIRSDAHQSPLPTGAVQFKVGPLKLTLTPPVAQKVQTVVANFYSAQGYQITFNEKGILTVGKRICDPAQSADWNKGCVVPSGPRF